MRLMKLTVIISMTDYVSSFPFPHFQANIFYNFTELLDQHCHGAADVTKQNMIKPLQK